MGEDEVTVEARRVLSLSPLLLKKLGPVELGEIAFVLSQYSHRLQQAVNREQSRITWATESVKKLVAKKVSAYTGYSYDERKSKAIADDDAAQKLESIRVQAQMRVDRVSFLSARASELAKTAMSLASTKRGSRD